MHGTKLGKTIWNDFNEGGLGQTFRLEIKDLYYFYLDDDTRSRLSEMGRVKRWFYMFWWLLKSMFLKLTPFRRVLLFLAFVFSLGTFDIPESPVTFDLNISMALVLLVLFLELKDKLLAQNELAAGRAVQNFLIPSDNPELDGWEIWMSTTPANEVGGDLVDYIHFDDSRLGLVLGDVAGKGLGSALYMSKLQATLRALAPLSDDLADLGLKMNHILCRDGVPQMFASLLYLEIKPGENAGKLLNAGHMPPVIVRDGETEIMKKGTSAFGLSEKSEYTEVNFSLYNDDIMVVYSDGLTEAQNEKGEFFGEKKLLKALKDFKNENPQSIGKSILKRVKYFAGEAPASDDLSIIILKRKV